MSSRTEHKKQLARDRVNNAIRAGKLVRPESCEKCGKTPSRSADGRSNIHAHHKDGYDHPLSVEFLCVKCHKAADNNAAKGERAGAFKHTTAFIIEVLKDDGHYLDVCKRYNISIATLYLWRKGRRSPNGPSIYE